MGFLLCCPTISQHEAWPRVCLIYPMLPHGWNLFLSPKCLNAKELFGLVLVWGSTSPSQCWDIVCLTFMQAMYMLSQPQSVCMCLRAIMSGNSIPLELSINTTSYGIFLPLSFYMDLWAQKRRLWKRHPTSGSIFQSIPFSYSVQVWVSVLITNCK
jgi:hypothetical protein